MVTREEARQKVEQQFEVWRQEAREAARMRKNLTAKEREVLGFGPEDDLGDYQILDDLTIEDDFGWVFFYQSKAFIETGDISRALAGNVPFLVSRADGRLHLTGPAHHIQYYIDNFKRTGNPQG
jgi:hypothetical protein